MSRFITLALLIVATFVANAKVTLDVYVSWVNGKQQMPSTSDIRVYISDQESQYTDQFIPGPVEKLYARVDTGMEVTKWSWGANAISTDEPSYSNEIKVTTPSRTLSWQADWKDEGEGKNKTIYLGVHLNWLKYTINFDPNGATGTVIPLNGVYNTPTVLPTAGLTRTGYTFMGWSRSKEATSPDSDLTGTKDFGKIFNFTWDNKTTTLYAVWRTNAYDITYDANGGTFADGTLKKSSETLYNNKYTPPAAPTRGGYTFGGSWTNATLRNVTADTKMTTAADHTLFATWNSVGSISVQTAKVADEPGADGSVSGGGSFAWGDTCHLNATKSTGSVFVGWSKNDENGEIVSTAGSYPVTVTEKAVYYAHFKLEEYTVTFMYKNSAGELITDRQTVKYGHAATAPTASDYPHYAFQKWDTYDYLSVKANLIVNAVYTSTVLTVTFNANGGTVTANDRQYDIGDKYGELPVPERPGYEYGGCWWTHERYGDMVSSNTEVVSAGSQTLYAHWTAKTLTVCFDADGGEAPSKTSISVTFDSYYGTLPTTKRTGYTFDGWYGDDAEKVSSSSRVTMTEDHTLTARWTAKTFWVTLRGEGGTVDPDEIEVIYDKKYEGLTDAERTGYTFLGWFLSTAADAKRVKNGDRVSITANQSLYAHWSPKVYKLTFDPNNGSLPAEQLERDQAYDATYDSLPEPVREHYDFLGWYDENERRVSASDKYRKTADQTLKAKWQAKSYQVYFRSNGGSGSTSSITLKWDESKELTPNGFNKTGYGFIGWDTNEDGATVVYGEQQVVSNLNDGNDLTLYAVWSPISYTVQFEKGSESASGSMPQKTLSYGESYTLPANQFTNGGRSFGGWRGSDYRQYEEGQVVSNLTATAGGIFVLTALWEDDFIVRFNKNGGSGEMDDEKMYVSADSVISSNKFTRVGYTFKGWATTEKEADEGKVRYLDGATITRRTYDAGTIVELFATWTINSYTVRFFSNGGNGDVREMQAKYDEDVTAPSFTRNGFDLVGWTSDPSTDSFVAIPIKNLTTVPNDCVNLYARWRRKRIESKLSIAADCAEDGPNTMALELLPGGDGKCEDIEFTQDAGGNGQCVRLSFVNQTDPDALQTGELMTSVMGSGELSFSYQVCFAHDVDKCYFNVTRSSTGSEEDKIVDDLHVTDIGTWRDISCDITVSGDDVASVITWQLYGYAVDADYVLIDNIKWRPKNGYVTGSVGITYRLNDGTVAPKDIITNVTCKVGAAIGALPVAKSASREFLGWATDAKASAADVSESWVVPAADTQLYAVWKASENPEPTVADRPVIGEGFKFTTDPRFDYVIWKKNDLMEADWTKHDTVTGNGQPVALPMFVDQQGFFKVEVIQRGSK